MKQFLLFISIIGLISLASCRKDFSTQPSTGQLEFSKDTVFLDTIFSEIGSSTYTLKVYNRSNEAITIPTISLKDGENSRYRLNVDGIAGNSFNDIDILAKDSIFVFVEVTVSDLSTTELLYVDELLFDTGDKQQDVKLVTLVRDAVFLFPDKIDGVVETLLMGINDEEEEIRIEGRFLNENHPINGNEYIFTNEKPYVIYGYMKVGSEDDQPKTLTVEAGAEIHFHANSGLLVGNGSSLHVMGTQNIEGQENTEVVFQGDRLEPAFENISGQWGYIRFLTGSVNNYINYATIKNGLIGLVSGGIQFVEVPTLEITNSQIYNNSLFGILGLHTNIKGRNLALNNSGNSAFAAMVGGVYNFTHCTFANSINQRSTPNVWLLDSNIVLKGEDDELETRNFYSVNFTNCIIDGYSNMELGFDQQGTDTEFNMHFANNLIQFNDTQNTFEGEALYNFDDTNLYTNNIFNGFLDYKNLSLNELNIGENSDAIGKASFNGTLQAPIDILGKTRANPADVGSYEHVIFEE